MGAGLGVVEVEAEEEEAAAQIRVGEGEEKESTSACGPPPPPLSPLQKCRRNGLEAGASLATDPDQGPKTPQPLATISIQDLTSIQLRRTTAKMNATKTFSAPPPRSVSMTNGKPETKHPPTVLLYSLHFTLQFQRHSLSKRQI